MSVTRAAKVGRIARRELWTTLTRPGFIISTILVPLLPVFMLFLNGLLEPDRILGGPEPARVGVVDQTGLLNLKALDQGPGATPHAQHYPSPPPACPPRPGRPSRTSHRCSRPRPPTASPTTTWATRASPPPGTTSSRGSSPAWRSPTPTGSPPADLTTYQLRDPDRPNPVSPFGAGLPLALRRALLAGRVPPAILHRVLGSVAHKQSHVLDPTGHEVPEQVVGEDIRRFLVPTMAALFLSVALFAGAGYLLLGPLREKENRILELLLASVTPDELLSGKLLGIGGAGLLQFALWVCLLAIPLAILAPMIGISLTPIAWATAFFLAGYALFGALMLGVGAIADTARHAQQLSGVFTLAAMIPFMFSFLIIQSPNGLFARVLTFVPVTAPITVMFRMSAGHLAPRRARLRPGGPGGRRLAGPEGRRAPLPRLAPPLRELGVPGPDLALAPPGGLNGGAEAVPPLGGRCYGTSR